MLGVTFLRLQPLSFQREKRTVYCKEHHEELRGGSKGSTKRKRAGAKGKGKGKGTSDEFDFVSVFRVFAFVDVVAAAVVVLQDVISDRFPPPSVFLAPGKFFGAFCPTIYIPVI